MKATTQERILEISNECHKIDVRMDSLIMRYQDNGGVWNCPEAKREYQRLQRRAASLSREFNFLMDDGK